MSNNDAEILLRATAGRIEFHHRLNEAVSLLERLNAPDISTLSEARAAVATRIDALLTLGGPLHCRGTSELAAPAASTAAEGTTTMPWPASSAEDTCH